LLLTNILIMLYFRSPLRRSDLWQIHPIAMTMGWSFFMSISRCQR